MEVLQAAIEVHDHHPGKTEDTTEGFVVADLVVLINKVRQHDAKEGGGRVHDRPFGTRRVSETDIKERVLDSRLRQAQYRQLSKLPRAESTNWLALGKG